MNPRQLLSAALIVAFVPAVSYAHRVGADAAVSADGTSVTVEAWFSGGKTPEHGTVVVLRSDGSECLRGEMVNGQFVFHPDRRDRYAFDIQLGEGHAKTVTLTDEQAAQLQPGGASTAAAPSTQSAAPVATTPVQKTVRSRGPFAGRDDESGMGMRVLLGLAVIAALTAVGLSVGASRRVRRLEKRLGVREERS